MKKNPHQYGLNKDNPDKVIAIPKVSAFPSRKEWEEACWQKVLHSKEWLDCFITPYERRNLVMRAAVADRSHVGISYREIGREFWLSPQTISTIKKGLSEKKYRSYAERSKTERKKRIYSVDHNLPKRLPHRMGAPHKTKYGTIYI